MSRSELYERLSKIGVKDTELTYLLERSLHTYKHYGGSGYSRNYNDQDYEVLKSYFECKNLLNEKKEDMKRYFSNRIYERN